MTKYTFERKLEKKNYINSLHFNELYFNHFFTLTIQIIRVPIVQVIELNRFDLKQNVYMAISVFNCNYCVFMYFIRDVETNVAHYDPTCYTLTG